MKLRDKIIFSAILLIALFWFLSLIESILTPFISAIIISYFLNPIANKIEKNFKLSRGWSVFIILGIFILAIITTIILVFPVLYDQFLNLINVIPSYVNVFAGEFYPKIVNFLKQIGVNINGDAKSYLTQENLTKLFGISNSFLENVMKSGVATVNILSLIFITPILTFYILKDWSLLINVINKNLPTNYKTDIKGLFAEIDDTLSDYVRGQFNVCFILGVLYATGLTAIGLKFGLLIGFLTGIMSFIPYVGMLFGVAVAIIVGWFNWGFDVVQFSMMAVIFVIGQVIEGNFLTPKLVGEKIGLHPVWVIFGLFAFGVLFGFVGILLAVPMTAIIGVLVKFTAAKYRKYFVKKTTTE